MRTDPSTNGRNYRKLVNNAVFICNESLFIVSAAATSAFQLKHTPWLLPSICLAGYQIRSIEYGKILVMLLYGKYYWHVYEVYNKYIIIYNFKFQLAQGNWVLFIDYLQLRSIIENPEANGFKCNFALCN